MQQIKIEEIEAKTRDILEEDLGKINELDLPINLAKILKRYKFVLYYALFKDPNVGGTYKKQDNLIVVAKDDPIKRQFFTVAHELGHFFLHKKAQDIFYRKQATEFNGEGTMEEKQANWFAASLLMPRELVLNIWKERPSVDYLAAKFGVSRSAAFWRLKNLKVI